MNKKAQKAGINIVIASPPTSSKEPRHQRQEFSEWKALLCTLIADRELRPLRHDAKKLLRRLCVSQVTAPGSGLSYGGNCFRRSLIGVFQVW